MLAGARSPQIVAKASSPGQARWGDLAEASSPERAPCRGDLAGASSPERSRRGMLPGAILPRRARRSELLAEVSSPERARRGKLVASSSAHVSAANVGRLRAMASDDQGRGGGGADAATGALCCLDDSAANWAERTSKLGDRCPRRTATHPGVVPERARVCLFATFCSRGGRRSGGMDGHGRRAFLLAARHGKKLGLSEKKQNRLVKFHLGENRYVRRWLRTEPGHSTSMLL